MDAEVATCSSAVKGRFTLKEQRRVQKAAPRLLPGDSVFLAYLPLAVTGACWAVQALLQTKLKLPASEVSGQPASGECNGSGGGSP